MNKYPYHQALPDTNVYLSSWVKGYFRTCYYRGYKLGVDNADIKINHFTTATRRGWEAGFKQRQVIQLLTRGET